MPEVLFDVRWPDGSLTRCYSPSTVVRAHLAAGASYALADFVSRSRAAMAAASERVRQTYGAPCSRAAATLRHIEHLAARFAPDAAVRVERLAGPAEQETSLGHQ